MGPIHLEDVRKRAPTRSCLQQGHLGPLWDLMLESCVKPSSLVVWDICNGCRVVKGLQEMHLAALLFRMDWLLVVMKNRSAVEKLLPLVNTKYEEEGRVNENGVYIIKKVPVSLLELTVRFGHLQTANELRWWDMDYKNKEGQSPLWKRPSYEVPCYECQVLAARRRAGLETQPEYLTLESASPTRPASVKPMPKTKSKRSFGSLPDHEDGGELGWIRLTMPLDESPEEELCCEELEATFEKLCPPSPPHQASEESTVASSSKSSEAPQNEMQDWMLEEETDFQASKTSHDGADQLSALCVPEEESTTDVEVAEHFNMSLLAEQADVRENRSSTRLERVQVDSAEEEGAGLLQSISSLWDWLASSLESAPQAEQPRPRPARTHLKSRERSVAVAFPAPRRDWQAANPGPWPAQPRSEGGWQLAQGAAQGPASQWKAVPLAGATVPTWTAGNRQIPRPLVHTQRASTWHGRM